MKAILLISHGSRSPKTKAEVSALIDQLKNKTKFSIIEQGYLEIESPSIPEGIDICVKKGASSILVLLNFLNSGRHVDTDIPNIINESQKKYPQVLITISRPVGQHSQIVDLFIDMAK